jgi:large repetitive protein
MRKTSYLACLVLCSAALLTGCEELQNYLDSQKDDEEQATTPAKAPDPDYVFSYDFDETGGTTAIDSSSNGSNGTLVKVARGAGKHGRAVSFPDDEARVETILMPPTFESGCMSIECWFKATENNPAHRYTIISCVSVYDLSLMLEKGKVAMKWDDATVLESASEIALDTWYYLVVTSDGNYLRIYLNGTEDSNRAIAYPTGLHTGPYTIGSRFHSIDFRGETFLGGTIDEFTWWKRALTAAEIQERYSK